MSAIRPDFAREIMGRANPNGITLTQAEYDALTYLLAHPIFNYEPVMTSAGEIMTASSGDIYMEKVIYAP